MPALLNLTKSVIVVHPNEYGTDALGIKELTVLYLWYITESSELLKLIGNTVNLFKNFFRINLIPNLNEN